MRLYKATMIDNGTYEEDEYGWPTEESEPEGWKEYAIERWGIDHTNPTWVNGYRPFFFPSDQKVYRSRSAAQARVDLINHWGGTAVLEECTPMWTPVVEANRLRRAQRVRDRVSRKQQELNELRAELDLIDPVEEVWF